MKSTRPGEERLLAMDRVVLLGERAVDVDELEADELEPALLEPGEHAADEQALDAVGLDEEERSLEFRHGLGAGLSIVSDAVERVAVAVVGRRRAGPGGPIVRGRAAREHRVAARRCRARC